MTTPTHLQIIEEEEIFTTAFYEASVTMIPNPENAL